MKEKIIAIIGSGAWGMALAKIFGDNHQIIQIFRRDGHLENLAEITKADYIFVVVPTEANREVFVKAKPYIEPHQIIILCSKGLEQNSNKFIHEIAREYFIDNKLAVLSGPNFAHEIYEDLPAISTISSPNIEIANELAKLSTKNFVLYPNNDVISTEFFGALKNVIAIACGISMGLKLGENFKAAIITRAIVEIQNLIKHLGGKLDSIITPAGIGDIILTCNSEKSRNTNFGIALVEHNTDLYLSNHTVEGYYTLKTIYNIAKENKLNLPIIFYLYEVAYLKKMIDKNEFIQIINKA